MLLNLGLTVAFLIAGLKADSSALIANGIDNASDSIVYAISLVALGRAARLKRLAARVCGILLLLFALGVVADVVRRFLEGSEPIGGTMILMAAAAAVINAACLLVLRRIESPDVNLRAAKTFSFNDFISNGGVLAGGILVSLTAANWPDLVVGAATALIALWGGVSILRDVQHEGSTQ
nr:cation transporter [Sphingomonas sp. G-3-2-10]